MHQTLGFKEQCDLLAQMKTEAEHLQHLLQKTKVKIQRDFEVWWSAQRSSKPNRTPVSSRGSSRTSLRTSVESSHVQSMMPKEGSRESARRKEESDRMISPRTAWRTPPIGKGSANGQTSKDLASSGSFQNAF